MWFGMEMIIIKVFKLFITNFPCNYILCKLLCCIAVFVHLNILCCSTYCLLQCHLLTAYCLLQCHLLISVSFARCSVRCHLLVAHFSVICSLLSTVSFARCSVRCHLLVALSKNSILNWICCCMFASIHFEQTDIK